MSIFHDNAIVGASGQATGYNLTRSLRFRSSASAYLNRTPASAGNQQRWTFSTWVKRGALGATQVLFGQGTGTGANGYGFFRFDSTDILQISCSPNGATSSIVWSSTPVYRDPSAWYHVVAVLDTTQATAANRFVLYVNGVAQSGSFSTTPTQNANIEINRAAAHQIGCANAVSLNNFLDGYQTEINFIDGQALTPSSFGETSSTTGVWQPKRYTGTYGTNGFYLPFTDNSALTSGSNAGLGKDFSGNGNYWNTNNISITSGVTYDSMTDVPTLTSATAANFTVMNPLDQAGGLLVTDGNLKTTANTGWDGARATFSLPSSGKYYWETTCISRSTGATVGLLSTTAVITGDLGAAATGYVYNSGDGQKYNNGSASAYGATWGTNDVIGIAWDADTGTLTFYKNGTSQGTAWSSLSGTYSPAIGVNGSDSMAANFGQRPFAYTPPTGYVALNTYNLPTPTIGATASSQANKYFDAITWTGTGTTSNRTITGLNFQPDFVWAKSRSAAYDHCLYDAVRGAGANKELISNNTNAEGGGNQDQYGYLSSFNSDGFSSTVGSLGQNLYFNDTAYPAYVAWNWKANGTGVTNTAGSITSTVSVNTTSGFSIVTYTSTTGTVGHGLGVAPAMIIMKATNLSDQWTVGHQYLNGGSSPWNYGIPLNTSAATQTNSGFWNNTAPTSTVFSQGSWDSGYTKVAYCFAEIAGYSKIGSFIGNGSTDGTFVYTGFRPKYIMSKSTSASRFWFVTDTSRDPYNVCNLPLFPNDSQGETAGTTDFDILSNGFKARTTNAAVNGNGETIIYIAFAENPFKYSLAR